MFADRKGREPIVELIRSKTGLPALALEGLVPFSPHNGMPVVDRKSDDQEN